MTRTFTIAASLLMTVLIASSCKKDRTGPGSVQGKYVLYELESYDPPEVVPLPSPDGGRGEVTVSLYGEADATLRIVLYDDSEVVLDSTFQCLMGKDADGDIFMTKKTDQQTAAYFFDNEIDFYAIQGFRAGGRK